MAKKILKIVLIVAFSIVGLLISMNPIFIILAVLAIVTTLKPKETTESPAGKKYMAAIGHAARNTQKLKTERISIFWRKSIFPKFPILPIIPIAGFCRFS